ncbi:MAG: carbohydrate kinase, partial [Bacteroidales bacterium]|nr:carbohydrate kinase [Bacteroidales bacterium]
VFGFGETVLDIIFKDGQPKAAKPGGSVLNAFVSLGRLGWKPCFVSEYGQDNVGRLIEEFLVENGVNTRYVNRFNDGQSALAMAFLDDDNNANYTFYKNFPDERLQELPEDIAADDIILFGSIYASSREVRRSVLRFLEMGLERGAIIIYDPNFRRAHLAELEELKPRIIENINYADIVRGSDEDFYLIFGAERPEKVREIIDNETKLLLYTQNTDNVKVFLNSLEASIPAEKIKTVSTIGAGDNFNAGIIHWLLKNGTTRAGLQLLQEEDLGDMAGTGIRFATNVCLGFDNYISHDFARGILSE